MEDVHALDLTVSGTASVQGAATFDQTVSAGVRVSAPAVAATTVTAGKVDVTST